MRNNSTDCTAAQNGNIEVANENEIVVFDTIETANNYREILRNHPKFKNNLELLECEIQKRIPINPEPKSESIVVYNRWGERV